MCNNRISRSAIWRDDLSHQQKWQVAQERLIVVPKGENEWRSWVQSWDSLTKYVVRGNNDGTWSLLVAGTEYWDEDIQKWMVDPRANGFVPQAPGYVSTWELRLSTADEAVQIAQEIL